MSRVRCVPVDAPPPAVPQDPVPHEFIAASASGQPGQWFMVVGVDPTYATPINCAAVVVYRPRGSYEAMARNGQLYVRYVGEADLPMGPRRARRRGAVSG